MKQSKYICISLKELDNKIVKIYEDSNNTSYSLYNFQQNEYKFQYNSDNYSINNFPSGIHKLEITYNIVNRTENYKITPAFLYSRDDWNNGTYWNNLSEQDLEEQGSLQFKEFFDLRDENLAQFELITDDGHSYIIAAAYPLVKTFMVHIMNILIMKK